MRQGFCCRSREVTIKNFALLIRVSKIQIKLLIMENNLKREQAFWDLCHEESWVRELRMEFNQIYMRNLYDFLQNCAYAGKEIYPPMHQWFEAFKLTPLVSAKVIVLGQDPYHSPGQAHGLCFSVKKNIRLPPSLKNIYKELQWDLNIRIPNHGCLETWAQQGVFLLNTILTVERGKAGSHQKKGWEQFTDKVITLLNAQERPLVFWLWGAHAQKKAVQLDREKHLLLEAPHPSPLSAHRGFLGGRYFSRTNAFLRSNGMTPIIWDLC